MASRFWRSVVNRGLKEAFDRCRIPFTFGQLIRPDHTTVHNIIVLVSNTLLIRVSRFLRADVDTCKRNP